MPTKQLPTERPETSSTIGPEGSRAAVVVREAEPHEREEWDRFVASADNGHILQAWSWGEYKRRSGWKPVRLAVLEDGTIRAAAQMLIRPFAGVSLAYVPRGPALSADDTLMYTRLIEELHQHARRHRAIFLKIEPNESADSTVETTLRHNGFVVSPRGVPPEQPWATLKVDLSGGPDAVQERIQKRTRQYVRAADRHLDVRAGTSRQDIERFYALTAELADRREIPEKPIEYYSDLLEELAPRQEATLLLAELDGHVIAGLTVLAFGTEGVSLHSGSSSRHNDKRANHLLQWKGMEWCMERGCTRYDMWGVFERRSLDSTGKAVLAPLVQDDIKPALRGIFRFKKSFGSESVRFIGAFDYAYNRPMYLLWSRLPRIQAKLKDTVHEARSGGAVPMRVLQRLTKRWRSG